MSTNYGYNISTSNPFLWQEMSEDLVVDEDVFFSPMVEIVKEVDHHHVGVVQPEDPLQVVADPDVFIHASEDGIRSD